MLGTLFDIPVNKTVLAEDRIRLGGQNLAIYRLLKRGGRVSLRQMVNVSGAFNISARIGDIRDALGPFGQTVKLVARGPSGLTWYEIRNL